MKPLAILGFWILVLPFFAWSDDSPALRLPGKDKWDKHAIPEKIPEYPFGPVSNYGDGGQINWYLVYCEEDKPADVERYLTMLKALGWKIKEATRSGTMLENDGDTLQVTFYATAQRVAIELHRALRNFTWPTQAFPELPLFHDQARSINFVSYEYDTVISIQGTTTEAIERYSSLLRQSNWTQADDSWQTNSGNRNLRLQFEDQGEGLWYLRISIEE